MADSNDKKILPLSLAALGVVYGDIGTSPLYALQQSLHGMEITLPRVLGVLSLIFWSLILVISTCYITIFLRADNKGEGGILALVSLLKRKHEKRFPPALFLIGIVGAGLLFGDGMLTPAISVISAIEGLKVTGPEISQMIIPISFLILLLLFLSQRYGTEKVGFAFGPIIFCWFLTIGVLGMIAVLKNPVVLRAINPYYAVTYLIEGGNAAFFSLGGVFLVITGAEAMYADLGHFGRTPIRLSWFAVVLPMLLLNYFGQGAHLLQNPSAIANSFYLLSPSWFIYPLLAIATLATIIASQAVISASFSLASQGILLNVLPRMSIIHTSKTKEGQVFVPQINVILGCGTLALVFFFQNSESLAAAYGMSVNLVMIIVALLVISVARMSWNWSYLRIGWTLVPVILIYLIFLAANFHKIFKGAWIPLAFALIAGVIMITWNKGISFIQSQYYMKKKTLSELIKEVDQSQCFYVEELTAVYVSDSYDQSGGNFLHYLLLNRIFPKTALIVKIVIDNYPFVYYAYRYDLKELSSGIHELTIHYGFMQKINLPAALQTAKKTEIFPFTIDFDQATYMVEKINLAVTNKKNPPFFYWQKKLFVFLLRNSSFDIEFYQLPHDRTISMGAYLKF